MNPLSPQTRNLLAKTDTAQESLIPPADLPRTEIAGANGHQPTTAAALPAGPMSETPPPAPGPVDQVPVATPALVPAPVDELPLESTVAPPREDLPPPMDEPPMAQAASDNHPPFSDDDGPPLRDDDGPPPDFINFDEMDGMLGGPPINHHEEAPSRPSFAPAGGAPAGARPFPPALEINKWYRLVVSAGNQPVAILDHVSNKAVHSYAVPPDRFNFKVNLGAIVADATTTFRSPLPVGELADRLDRMKFCFETRTGDEGTKVVLKIIPEGASPDDKGVTPQILEGKPAFKGKGGDFASPSSLPAVAGASGFAPMAPMGNPGNSLAKQAVWLEAHRAQLRARRR